MEHKETPENIFETKKIEKIIEEYYDVLLMKRPHYDTIDYDAVSGNDIWLCEVKRRYINHDDFPTNMIRKKKLDDMLEIASKESLPLRYIVLFNDGCYALYLSPNFDTSKLEIKISGRDDRDDEYEAKQPHYYIPIELFKKIK